jgi:hypothetical protein
MHAVVHLNNYDPHPDSIVADDHRVVNPSEAADHRAVQDTLEVEWYPGGGNIHIVDSDVTEVSELANGAVLVRREDQPSPRIPNAELTTVYDE